MKLTRLGKVNGREIRLTKGVALSTGSANLEIAYLLENLPPGEAFHFGVEFNFAAMPSGADDRFFYAQDGKQLGQLGRTLDLPPTTKLGLVDEWLGIDVSLTADQPTGFYAFPIETVSQSEGGFELVHQSVCVHPHWTVRGDAQGTWSVVLQLNVDTKLAEQRMESQGQAVASGR